MTSTEGVEGWVGPLESIRTLHSPAQCTRSRSVGLDTWGEGWWWRRWIVGPSCGTAAPREPSGCLAGPKASPSPLPSAQPVGTRCMAGGCPGTSVSVFPCQVCLPPAPTLWFSIGASPRPLPCSRLRTGAGSGKSDCLIKTKHCKGLQQVLRL